MTSDTPAPPAEKAVIAAAVAHVEQTMLVQSTVSRTLGWCPECSIKDGNHEAHCTFGPLVEAVVALKKQEVK
jgi:hypothetical protein